MKYICLRYTEPFIWDCISEEDQKAFIKNCRNYDQELRQNGTMIACEALQSTEYATTIRYRSGKISIVDGPFAATREQLGEFIILEANDLNHAIAIISKHPSIRLGSSWEIRPAADYSDPESTLY